MRVDAAPLASAHMPHGAALSGRNVRQKTRLPHVHVREKEMQEKKRCVEVRASSKERARCVRTATRGDISACAEAFAYQR